MATKFDQGKYPDAPGPTVLIGTSFEKFCYAGLEHVGVKLTPHDTQEEQFNIGENAEGYEFKKDPHSKWGHLSIEVAERTHNGGPWYLSGIFRRDNTQIYIQGDESEQWAFPKSALLDYAASIGVLPAACIVQALPGGGVVEESFGTIRKFYLEYEQALQIGGTRMHL